MRTIISYEPLWKTLQEKGISQYYLLQNGLDNKTLDSRKKGKNITLLTLEKLCVGFDLTPNDLLIPSEFWREMAFREPMPVTHIRCFHFFHGLTGFPVCPQCGRTLEREYQPYCDRCGQCLDWKGFSKATIILPQK